MSWGLGWSTSSSYPPPSKRPLKQRDRRRKDGPWSFNRTRQVSHCNKIDFHRLYTLNCCPPLAQHTQENWAKFPTFFLYSSERFIFGQATKGGELTGQQGAIVPDFSSVCRAFSFFFFTFSQAKRRENLIGFNAFPSRSFLYSP